MTPNPPKDQLGVDRMVVSGGAVSPENRSNEAREIAEQYLYDGDSDRPLNLGYYALLDVADSVAALESAHVAALARIAAVEARIAKIREWAYANHGGVKSPAEVWPGLAALLAASPTQIPEEHRLATNESALTTIVRVVSETYTDAGVLLWLNAKNRHLPSKPDGNWRCTPAEYIAAGHAAEVLDAARRIEGPW